MKSCNYCGKTFEENLEKCPSCGSKDFLYKCNNCGSTIETGSFCSKCGTRAGTPAKTCPNCGANYFTVACPQCGYIPRQEKKCPNCGKMYSSHACPDCGYTPANASATSNQTIIYNNNVEPSKPSGKECNKWAAFALCLLLGFFGAHKFYEGKVGMGILYIFTLGLFMIGWFADLIIILSKPTTYYV